MVCRGSSWCFSDSRSQEILFTSVPCHRLVQGPENHFLPGLAEGEKHLLHPKEGLSKDVLPASTEEVWTATGSPGPVLRSSSTVWFRDIKQDRTVGTAETNTGTPLPRTGTPQDQETGGKNFTSDPYILTLSLEPTPTEKRK